MSKKIIAISCIILMLLFHYTRIISYWGCELVHLNNSSTTCDCANQSKESTADAQQSSSQKTSKDNSEELFSANKVYEVAASFSKKIISPDLRNRFNILTGFINKIFQPPRV